MHAEGVRGKPPRGQTAGQAEYPPPDVARGLPGPVTVHGVGADVRASIENTAGARLTPHGLELDLTRFQKPDQGLRETLREGVFYSADPPLVGRGKHGACAALDVRARGELREQRARDERRMTSPPLVRRTRCCM